ncbi:MAG TPA: hypothetical protein VGA66_03840 [Mycobacterium sp.]
MKKTIVVATTWAMLAVAVGAAGPAAAGADDALIHTPSSPDPWVMPDVEDMVLAQAERVVEDAVDQEPLTFKTEAVNHEAVHNLQNWVVCGESPEPGSAISHETETVTLSVKRPGGQHCGL